MWQTHEVFNQVPRLGGCNLYATDPALQQAVARAGAAWHDEALHAQGAVLGHADTLALGARANRHPPVLHTHDAHGRRIDRVEVDPSWDRLMGMLYAAGVHSAAWLAPRTGAHVARAATFYLHGQVEAGSLCPVTMSFAALPLLRREPALWAELGEKFAAREYDPRDIPLPGKRSIALGMGLTEKQGGSDLRGITTTAHPHGAGGRGAQYALRGHKWFYSAPACDAHLVLAHSDEALSCFYVPRWLPDGERNAVRIQRLKDKLGNRSNASGEVEFEDALGILVGEPGRGIPTLIEMAAQTRLDCVLGSAALMRRALVEALHHARHRQAFGRPLAEQALMRNVLADLALESEAAVVLALHLAAAVDGAHEQPSEGSPQGALARARRRILTPAAKFWVCKRAVGLVAECMEVWGGNGYVEDSPLPRLLREAPVNSIWEGSGNVMCLDVLRALARDPDAAALLFHELAQGCAGEARLTHPLHALSTRLHSLGDSEWAARHVASQLVLLSQAVLLRQHAPAVLADTFIASRFAPPGGQVPGLLGDPSVAQHILERAWTA